ncbi:MAG: glycosyltransferase family 4 protein [Candidatus Sericytochromatia bacterium]|nr:glycosyltransferase family 4 protein [Candidatus Sericytochromatia bacterium]
MRLALVCNEYPPLPSGGIGTFVHTLAPGLAARGHAVTVVGLGNEATERLEDGVRVVSLPGDTRRGLAGLRNRLRLQRWLRREGAQAPWDVVEVPDFQGMLPFRLPGTPVVVRLHLSATAIARQADQRAGLGTHLFERLTLQRHPDWIAVSQHASTLTQETFGLTPRSVTVQYYPVSPPTGRAQSLALPGRFWLYAGTLSRRKGALLVAEAAREALAAHPAHHLVFAGPSIQEAGEDTGETIRAIVGPRLAERVHLLGRLDRATLFAVMQAADALLMPSSLETFGLVAAEAMWCGTPVIATQAPPFTEYLEDGRTGILVPPDDAPALASALARLGAFPAWADALREASQAHIRQHFSLAATLTANEALYERLRENTPRRPR